MHQYKMKKMHYIQRNLTLVYSYQSGRYHFKLKQNLSCQVPIYTHDTIYYGPGRRPWSATAGASCSSPPRYCSDTRDNLVPRWVDNIPPSENDHECKRKSRDHAHCQESTREKVGRAIELAGAHRPVARLPRPQEE